MAVKKVLVVCGNPDVNSFSGGVASAYEKGATEAKHSVRRMNIGEMKFDPVLHNGYKAIQRLEPDLLTFQENVRWADHLVFIYPSWWNAMPAVLKGLFDRAWLPGFAFNFDKETKNSVGHLKGKTAHFFVIAGAHSPDEGYWCKCSDCRNSIERSITMLAGIKNTVTFFGEAEVVTNQKRRTWLKKVQALGKRGV